ncbi:trigger factor, partial [candidate division GN15 bacterium]
KFDEVKRSVTLKGFRKGKAPMAMIRSVYADEVKADVVDELIKATFPEAVRQHTLNVASRPTLTNLNFNDDGGFTYTATVEVFPDIPTVTFDKLEVPTHEIAIKDEEIDEVVAYFRKRHADIRVVNREARDGDIVIADMKKIADPKLALDTSDFPDSQIDLGNKMTVKEFREQLPGVKAGDQKQIEVVYPDDYSDNRFAGARITYDCTIKQVKEQILPEVNDGFAKLTGIAETVLELRLKIREDLTKRREDDLHREQKRELVRQVCEANPIPIPDGMVNDYLDSVVEDFKKNYPDAAEAEIRENYRQVGIDTMRWDMLWHSLAEQQKIEVSPADTEKWIEGFATRNSITVEQAQQTLNKSGRLKELRESLLEEKVMAFLTEKARMVPVPVSGKD